MSYENTARLRSFAQPDTSAQSGEGWVLIIVSFILIALVFFAVLYVVTSAKTVTSEPTCPEGVCSADIFTGEKTCPADSASTVQLGPGAICTSKDFCQSPVFACAVQPDSSTNCDGVCGTGNESCACVADKRCAEYIAAYFTFVRDAQTDSIESITQNTRGFDISTGEIQTHPPFSIGSANNTSSSCTITHDSIPLLDQPTCSRGVLAYLDTATTTSNVACVDRPGLNCAINTVLVYNTVTDTMSCEFGP